MSETLFLNVKTHPIYDPRGPEKNKLHNDVVSFYSRHKHILQQCKLRWSTYAD